MSEQYIIANKDEFTAVADAIRAKGQTTESLNWPNGFIDNIGAIETGTAVAPDDYKLETKTVSTLYPTSNQIITPSSGYYGLSQVTVPAIPTTYADTSGTTATASDILTGKKIVGANRQSITGSMVNNGAVSVTLNEDTTSYTIPAGYHNGSGTVSYTGKKLYSIYGDGSSSTRPYPVASNNDLKLFFQTGLGEDASSKLTSLSQVINLYCNFSYNVNGTTYYATFGGLNWMNNNLYCAGYGSYNKVTNYYESPFAALVSLETTAVDNSLGIIINNIWASLGLDAPTSSFTNYTCLSFRVDLMV